MFTWFVLNPCSRLVLTTALSICAFAPCRCSIHACVRLEQTPFSFFLSLGTPLAAFHNLPLPPMKQDRLPRSVRYLASCMTVTTAYRSSTRRVAVTRHSHAYRCSLSGLRDQVLAAPHALWRPQKRPSHKLYQPL
ncbi:hypothetical protein GGR52DRAFT_529212 [Hypoxylon sp. FL1284]|nr:hypothetical protein GGR52DRAFT_529212 [Hypoxylon sp. FL1284]